MLASDRRLTFEGCFNFRDLGGYRTADGRVVHPRRVYRADGPHALTDADVLQLGSLELATILDLRTVEELGRGRYVTYVSDVVDHHLPMLDVVPDTDDLPKWVDAGVVADRYRTMLDNAQESVAEILAVLSDPSAYPAMFHCSAGKDRTGVIAALLLGMLGVPDDTIIADYAMSGAAMQHLVEYYKRTYPGSTELLERLAPAMVAAHPDTMRALIEGIRRDFGTFDGYAEAVGAGGAPASLRAALLA
jgi:protein-tyrosine phosphatase